MRWGLNAKFKAGFWLYTDGRVFTYETFKTINSFEEKCLPTCMDKLIASLLSDDLNPLLCALGKHNFKGLMHRHVNT